MLRGISMSFLTENPLVGGETFRAWILGLCCGPRVPMLLPTSVGISTKHASIYHNKEHGNMEVLMSIIAFTTLFTSRNPWQKKISDTLTYFQMYYWLWQCFPKS